MNEYMYEALVNRVVDGDTVDVTIDLGFYQYKRTAIRLRGINAPEMNTPEGKAARAYLVEKLPPNTKVIIQSYKNPKDKYGRWLGDIYLAGSTSIINEQLVADGHAVEVV